MSEFIVTTDTRTDRQKANEPDMAEVLKVVQYAPMKRYKYFINKVVQTEMLWACGTDDRWAMMDDENRVPFMFPVWPAKLFAYLWLPPQPDLSEIEVRAIALDFALETLLPSLEVDQIAVCFDASDKGPVVTVEKLITDLKKALSAKKRLN